MDVGAPRHVRIQTVVDPCVHIALQVRRYVSLQPCGKSIIPYEDGENQPQRCEV